MARVVAWLGGVAFVASLAFGGYFYLVILAVSDSGRVETRARAAAIDALLFGIFAMHHSWLARSGAKRWVTRIIPPPLERSAYVWVASALFIMVCALWQPLPGLLYSVPPPAQWLLYAGQMAGVLLTWRAAAIIDGLELAGIRQVEGQARAVNFRTDGPFGLVRHPIYLGWILMVFATPLMTANRLWFAILTSAYLILAIPWEEKSLVEAFGDRYREYQAAVRWRLLPGIW